MPTGGRKVLGVKVSFRLKRDTHAHWKREARRKNTTISEAIREALETAARRASALHRYEAHRK
jgi:hypothetical protein